MAEQQEQPNEPLDIDSVLANLQNYVPQCHNIWELELSEAVTSIALTPKGKLAAVSSFEDEITIIDTETGSVKNVFDNAHKGGVNCLEFLSGTVLVSTGEDGTVKLWNIAKQVMIKEYIMEASGADRSSFGCCVSHLATSGDGLQFAAAAGKLVSFFSVASHPATADNITRKDFTALDATVEALKFDKKNGNLLAAYNGGVSVWDFANKNLDEASELSFPYQGACLSVDAHHSAKWVVAGVHDGSVHIWQLKERKQGGVQVLEMSCGGYEGPVRYVEFGPEDQSQWLGSAGGSKGIIWDFKKSPNGSIPTLTLGHRTNITAQAWQPDEPFLLATGSKDGKIIFHQVEDIAQEGEPNICLPGLIAATEGEDDEVTSIVWARDGLLLSGHVSGKVRGWLLPSPDDDDSSSEEEEEEQKS